MRKRLPSKLLTIQDILNTTSIELRDQKCYIHNGEDVPEIRLVCTILKRYITDLDPSKKTKISKYANVTVCDYSGNIIQINSWKYGKSPNQPIEVLENSSIGDIIEIIGRIKEYDSRKFILPDIISKSNIDKELSVRLENIYSN